MDNSIFTKQYYSKYTDEDRRVWKKLFSAQWDYLSKSMVAARWFYDGVRELQLNENSIPKFTEVNKVLAKNGWKIRAVRGIVDDGDFFTLLSQKVFPVTTWLRSMKNIDYLEEPDMFHDLFGHVPFLTNSTYTRFLERIGHHGVKVFATNNKDRQYMMSRFYWYTVEFGLVRRKIDTYDIYGAGILSSFQETQTVINKQSQKRFFNEDLLSEQFKKDDIQSFYAYLRRDLKFLNELKVENI